MKLKHLIPTVRFNSLKEVNIDFLIKNNITHLWLDVDNTVTEWGSSYVDSPIIEWVKLAKNAQISVVLVTNSNNERVDNIARQLEIKCYKGACKPAKSSLNNIAKQSGSVANKNIAIIGDQLFTDVLGANRIGATSVLLKPISHNEWWATKFFNRTRERLVWRHIFKDENYNDYMNT